MSEPSCQCQSWHKTHFPCKHFSAVFKFFKEWDFNSLLDSYRNSVFITLDFINLSDSNPVQKPPSRPFTSDDSRNSCGGDDYDPPDNAATPDIIEATIPSREYGETDGSNSQSSDPNMGSTESPLKRSNATKARCLQERIDALRSATFMVDDASVLESVTVEVESLLMQLKKSSPQENGLPLRQSPKKRS